MGHKRYASGKFQEGRDRLRFPRRAGHHFIRYSSQRHDLLRDGHARIDKGLERAGHSAVFHDDRADFRNTVH